MRLVTDWPPMVNTPVSVGEPVNVIVLVLLEPPLYVRFFIVPVPVTVAAVTVEAKENDRPCQLMA